VDIKSVVEREIKDYAGEGANGYAVMTSNVDGNEFTLVVHAVMDGKSFTFMSLSVGIIGDSVVIYEDRNDPSLTESLIQAGIPREKIILVSAGEEISVSA